MSLGIHERRVGSTPLLRATSLERKLGIDQLYLKLEGANPNGHKSDRIAHTIVRDAVESDKSILTIGSAGYLAMSLGSLAEGTDMQCVFFVPRVNRRLQKSLDRMTSVRVVETGGGYERAVEESRRNAREQGWYDANPGLENSFMAMIAYSPIAKELLRSLGEVPATVAVPVGTGSLLSGIHLGFRQAWALSEAASIPAILGGSAADQNAVVCACEKGLRSVQALQGRKGKLKPMLDPLINRQGVGGQQALDALYDSLGHAYGLSVEELSFYARLLKSTENVFCTPDSASALGAFVKALEQGRVPTGRPHVVVLSTGKTELSIRQLDGNSLAGGLPALINALDLWLQKFTDPKQEILEAVESALENGFVLGAFMGEQLVGLCVMLRMELDKLFPRYHLTYLAAEEGAKGRGVATQLFDRAVSLSGGELSLHVEPDNRRAIRLYQKMGMDLKYHRMVYRKQESDPLGDQ